jgi:hypothetical protein
LLFGARELDVGLGKVNELSHASAPGRLRRLSLDQC